MKNIKLSDITIKFGGKNSPKDEVFLDLYKKAFKNEIPTYWGMIMVEGIKPFSDFHPKIDQASIDRTHLKLSKGDLPPIYVYPQNGMYIMSDDYFQYYIYLYSGYKKIPCVILGKPDSKFVSDQVGPIKLPELSFEIIKK